MLCFRILFPILIPALSIQAYVNKPFDSTDESTYPVLSLNNALYEPGQKSITQVDGFGFPMCNSGVATRPEYTQYYNILTGAVQQVNSIIEQCPAGSTQSFTEFSLSLGKYYNPATVTPYQYGAYLFDSATGTSYTFHQGFGTHTPASYLNTANNALASLLSTSANVPEFIINVANKPLFYTLAQQARYFSIQLRNAGIVVNIIISMGFLTSFNLPTLVRERCSGAKLVQLVNGLSKPTYWLGRYLYDMTYNILVGAVVCAISILVTAAMPGAICDYEAFVPVYLVTILFSSFLVNLGYVLSLKLDTPAYSNLIMLIYSIILGIIAYFTVTGFQGAAIQKPSLENTAKILDWIFLVILPPYQYAMVVGGVTQASFNKLSQNEIIANGGIVPPYLAMANTSYTDMDTVGKYFIALIIYSVCIFVIFVYMESEFSFRLWLQSGSSSSKQSSSSDQDDGVFDTSAYEPIDSDVIQEKKYIQDLVANQKVDDSDHVLIINGLDKRYIKPSLSRTLGCASKVKGHHAVRGVNSVLNRGECFGLLGVNGAGKSTMLKMLTGEIGVSKGDAFLQGKSIKTDLDQARKMMGYCPQPMDSLVLELTARELLTYFGHLRGLSKKDIDLSVNNVIDLLDLGPWADKPIESYSGGNKRKTSTGLAMMGGPDCMMLDEPTSGVDPRSKRFLWNALADIRDQGHSIVLVSHYMEEAEALCTRMTIMVDGQYKCLGPKQHLINKYKLGYSLIVQNAAKVDDAAENNKRLRLEMESKFKNIECSEEHGQMLTWRIYDDDTNLVAKIFETVNQLKTEYHIQDFNVSQTPLEQLFLDFADTQEQEVAQKQIKTDILLSRENAMGAGISNVGSVGSIGSSSSGYKKGSFRKSSSQKKIDSEMINSLYSTYSNGG